MNREEMIRLHDLYNDEVINRGRLELIDQIFAADYVDHVPGQPDNHGPDGQRQFIAAMRGGFPDIQFAVEDRLVESDKLFVRWTARGTHKGDYLGVPATGKPIKISGMALHRFGNGKVQESWDHFDAVGLLQQLGAMPAAS